MRQPKYRLVYGEGENDYMNFRTKREVEKIYHHLLRMEKKDKKKTVIEINEGCYTYNFLTGDYSLIKGMVYIARNW